MSSGKKPISTRGKIAMVIVVLIGSVYWLMGKIEVWINGLSKDNKK